MRNREQVRRFLEYARAQGLMWQNGHYARRRQRGDGSWDILEGLDKSKDQSYFLALLRQEQIAAARFPVGDLQKSEVRQLAAQRTLVTATKKDSQGICFIGNVRMADFLRAFVPDKPGPIKNLTGALLGAHQGLHLYTLGQRRGIGVPSNTPSEAYVVVEKRLATNELIVAISIDWSLGGLYATLGAGSAPFHHRRKGLAFADRHRGKTTLSRPSCSGPIRGGRRRCRHP